MGSRIKQFALVTALLGALSIALALGIPGGELSAAPQEKLRAVTGEVVAWRLDEDGTVYVQVSGRVASEEGAADDAERDGGQALTWFRSPPRQNLQNDFEAMMLDVVLESRAEDSRVGRLTFTGGLDTRNDGQSPKTAFPIRSVGQP